MRTQMQLRVLVVDQRNAVIGIVSESDLLARTTVEQRLTVRQMLDGAPLTTAAIPMLTAAEVMTSPVIVVRTDDLAIDAVRLLIENRVKRLPVLNRQGQVVGLTSRRMLLNGLYGAPEPASVM